jgi:hypothetical protein
MDLGLSAQVKAVFHTSAMSVATVWARFESRVRFEPRGAKPLLDAIALLLDRAEAHLRHSGADPADQLMVIFTAGHENASRHWTADGRGRMGGRAVPGSRYGS